MDYAINNYRAKRFGDKYFVTTDHGSNCVLSEEEFRKLKQNNIGGELKEKLEEREIILTGRNNNEAVRLMRNRYHYLMSGSSLHIIVVTLRCNMNCVYCHASSKPKDKKEFDMSKETAKNTVDFIFQSPTKSIGIEFQGGEPLLNWDVVKYITEYSQEKGKELEKDVKISLVTNLSEMDDEKMDYLIKHDVYVCTSLDGPKELHDYNRNFAGGSSYEQVTKWVKRFNKEYEERGIKDKKVYALATLTRKSLSYPKEIVDEYVKFDFGFVHLRFLSRIGIAKQMWPKISYSIDEYLDFWKKAVEYIRQLNKEGKNIGERMANIMALKMCTESGPNYVDLRSPCGAAIGQLAYNYNGDIYTCDEARMIEDDLFLLGNVKKDKYKETVTCDKACAVVNASINDQYVCNSCVYKPYCGVCPVLNYINQGSIIGKIPETDRCKIFKEQFDWVVREKFINSESKDT
jgi:His-Xaa-Ser system radical SAM maturase HxsB